MAFSVYIVPSEAEHGSLKKKYELIVGKNLDHVETIRKLKRENRALRTLTESDLKIFEGERDGRGVNPVLFLLCFLFCLTRKPF